MISTNQRLPGFYQPSGWLNFTIARLYNPKALTFRVKLPLFVIAALILTSRLNAGIETISSGSFIINMGIVPQTINNGLKPYGMIYDLVHNYKVPVKWIINPAKLKDGIDFSHNGINYSGGPFIIPAEFRTPAVNARISYWQTQGVIGANTVTPISVNVFYTLRVMPFWSLGEQNGSLAVKYLINANIPTTAYNFFEPFELTCCNDLYITPHSDPKWPTHGNLYNWNLNCEGAIWMSCHAASATEDLFNPANKAQQLNFLSNKTGNATGNGPYEENALILWGNHAKGSTPYSYAYPADPIMQFIGPLDLSTKNGSEQIYLPKTSWRAGARIYVWDPTHADVPSKSPGPAAIVVSGRAYDDPNRGRVMMEAGHSHAKKSNPDNIAGQRAFFNFSYWVMNEKMVIPDLGSIPDTIYSGDITNLSFTLPPGHSASEYTILWSTTCGGTFSPNNTQTTSYTPPYFSVPTTCIISVTITDICGRAITETKVVIGICNPTITPVVTRSLCNGSSNGSIAMSIVHGDSPWTWNWSRVSPAGTGSGSGNTISNLIAGSYDITLTLVGGCTKSFSVNVQEPPLLTASNSVTQVLCNGASTGAITVNVNGGTAPYSFNWGGGITTQNRINIPAGSYTVTVTDANGCTATSSATVTQPSAMTITPSLTHVGCNGNSTAAINIAVSGGTGLKTFSWSNGASTQNISGITAGSYTLTVTDANGCTRTSINVITQPAALNLNASFVPVSCNGGNNGSIDLTVSGGTITYSYSWSNGANTQDISGLSQGTYSVTVTDANSCTAVISRAVTQPAPLALSIDVNDATCPDDANGSIDLSVNGGTSPYTYDWSNDGLEAPDNDTQDLNGILPGNYVVIVTDANGCTASILATVNAINNFPSAPTVINH